MSSLVVGRYYCFFGAVVLIGTFALMLFGVNSHVSDDIGPLLAGLVLSTYVFRFGLPWKWLNFLFLASFLVVGLLLGQPGLMWMGGYVAGSQFGVAWRLAVVKRKVTSKWAVNGQGIDMLTEARKAATETLHLLDGNKHERVVVEHGPARFEVAGALPSKLVCHRNPDADNDSSWAILSRTEHGSSESVEVPMGRMKGFIPSQYVHALGSVEAALDDFLKNPKAESLGPEWNTADIAFNLRLSLESSSDSPPHHLHDVKHCAEQRQGQAARRDPESGYLDTGRFAAPLFVHLRPPFACWVTIVGQGADTSRTRKRTKCRLCTACPPGRPLQISDL